MVLIGGMRSAAATCARGRLVDISLSVSIVVLSKNIALSRDHFVYKISDRIKYAKTFDTKYGLLSISLFSLCLLPTAERA